MHLNTKGTKAGTKDTKKYMKNYSENELAKIVFDAALKVHKKLGPGLLESAYLRCLAYEIAKSEVDVVIEKPLPLIYEEIKLDAGYRVDMLVGGKLIVEIKSTDGLNEVHMAQVLTYLRLSNCKLGLLINFNVVLLKEGVKRIINGTL
jgi:GxxExxY protein